MLAHILAFMRSVCTFERVPTCMSQTKSPETQVRGSVGDATKTVFNGVDGLVDSYIPKVKLRREREGHITENNRYYTVPSIIESLLFS